MIGSSAPILSRPIEPAVAARWLTDWGFLAHSDLPDRSGDAYLLVGLRDSPTLHHFDPERVQLWVNDGLRGSRLEITRSTAPRESDFSWGTVSIFDRLHVSNEYVTFGGHLTVAHVDDMTVVILVSPAPILRRGGHSQGWDQAALELAAFFGRVMIAVDYVPGFEARLSRARPLARYAAFIADSTRRFRASTTLREERPAVWTLLRGEQDRLEATATDDWREGSQLADLARLDHPG
jgi:hypothetical protein